MSSDYSQNLSMSSSMNDFSGTRRSSRRRSRNSSDDEDFVADQKELEKIEAKNPSNADHITPRSTSANQLIRLILHHLLKKKVETNLNTILKKILSQIIVYKTMI